MTRVERNARRVLVLETSSRSAAVAIAVDGVLVAQGGLGPDEPTTAKLLPLVQCLCRDAGTRLADLHAVYFSHGPGSFSGLRLAATVARVMHWAGDCQVVAVPTLEAIACGTVESTPRVAALVDAKRGWAYGAAFERDPSGMTQALSAVALIEPAVWLASIPRPFVIAGPGVPMHRAACDASGARIVESRCSPPDVADLFALGERLSAAGRTCDADQILPLYIRVPEAEVAYDANRARARARRTD